jgi:hypothetical protein
MLKLKLKCKFWDVFVKSEAWLELVENSSWVHLCWPKGHWC